MKTNTKPLLHIIQSAGHLLMIESEKDKNLKKLHNMAIDHIKNQARKLKKVR